MLTPDYTTKFKKDYRRAIKRNLEISLIDDIIKNLIDEIPLDDKHRDHPLYGDYIGCRECHIKPDWLLIYQIADGIIAFERTGTHSDLFG
ncbi:MAG: type II toxin-antitoxin system YafQ family toxin [Defluviitaleaceae bacterium]|nr:type II toxin-antitoxin system YafQ family toxin [Defluviitaleaceae bacterium]